MLSTYIMSVFARMPLAVAPAMGVNAYFTYNVVVSSKAILYLCLRLGSPCTS